MTPAEQIAAKHNSGLAKPGHNSVPGLSDYVDRLVTLEEEKAATAELIRELKAEAKEHGILPRAMALIAKQRMETDAARTKREAFESKVDTYKLALGLLD